VPARDLQPCHRASPPSHQGRWCAGTACQPLPPAFMGRDRARRCAETRRRKRPKGWPGTLTDTPGARVKQPAIVQDGIQSNAMERKGNGEPSLSALFLQDPPGLQVLVGLLFVLETALQETLQETRHFSANFRLSEAALLLLATFVRLRFRPCDPEGTSCFRSKRMNTCATPEKSCSQHHKGNWGLIHTSTSASTQFRQGADGWSAPAPESGALRSTRAKPSSS
jgi:hypothetical protein